MLLFVLLQYMGPILSVKVLRMLKKETAPVTPNQDEIDVSK